MSALRSPLVHFVVGGGLLFVLVHGLRPAGREARSASEPIVLTAEDVAHLRDDYARESGLEPTADDEVALIEKAVEEELLFREALDRGLDRDDRSIRHWLIEQTRSLVDDHDSDDETLYAQAQALGLGRKDLVVRRILVQKMRLLASRVGEQEVGEEELRAFYAEHAADYQQADRVSLWQVFLGSQVHGDDARRDAERLLAEIRSRRLAPAEAARRGDPFPLPPHLEGQSKHQLEKVFGPTLAVDILLSEEGSWSGPYASPYGVHLVWIEAREVGALPPIEAVRGRVLEAWREETRKRRVAELLRDLEARSSLRIASEAWQRRGNT